MKKKVITLLQFLKQVTMEFIDDNVLKYSASLSYYTIFSLAPMLIIIISVSGFLFGREAMEGSIYNELKGFLGSTAALQLQETIKNIHLSKDTSFATITSIIILLIGATGIFGEIQDSMNRIWGLKVMTKKVWWKLILTRLLSFSMILCLGFVMIVSLLLNALVAIIGSSLNKFISGAGDSFIPIIDSFLSYGITTIIFATIFKVLPDAKIKWKDVFVGALITSLLFAVGRFGIGYYLSKTSLATIYGAAGSVMIILLWTYYTSAILYLGAEFTKVYAKDFGGKILPNAYSEWIKMEQVHVESIVLKEEVKQEGTEKK